ncbi:hypothetical protein CAEBREN_07381 [Caenorhabditis brenneri]|uniref:Uncharacterized protein n=1 Tax=Caenorhabditis brenneri TaxID=135651 RepID=G0MWW2_CAEBE|nr:hypothetical protein CAEBREN_07381 [Caenorhabditis brenneri]
MSKFKDSKWSCDKKYAYYERGCLPEQLQDSSQRVIAGVCADKTRVVPNTSVFEGNTEDCEFFYVDFNKIVWESKESLKTLEQFSKFHKPPFFIRSLCTPNGRRIFHEDAMRLIPVALREQEESIGQDLYHMVNRLLYTTITEKEFFDMFEKLDINKGNIRLVPDIDQVYADENSDWELPYKLHTPDGKIGMNSCQAVFFIFQMFLCWKREECQKCSHELFEKEVVQVMAEYEKLDGTTFFTMDHISANFPKMAALLCTDCLQKLPKTLQPPLPDRNPADKISKEDLEHMTEEFGVPETSEYSKIHKIIDTWHCPVWMLRLFMIGGWLRRVFPLMEPELKGCILGSTHCLVPKYLRNYGDLEDFMDLIMNGKNEQFENALAKSKSRAEVLKQRKEMRKKNQGKATEKVPKRPKNLFDDRFFEMVDELLKQEELMKKMKPEKFTREPPTKKTRGDEPESSGEKSQEPVATEPVEEAEIVDLDSDKKPNHKASQVVRHTQYEYISAGNGGNESTDLLGKLNEGSTICSNLKFVNSSNRYLVNEFFYLNCSETFDKLDLMMIKMDEIDIGIVAKLEEFIKAFDSPKLYIRCLLDDVVFFADFQRILKLAKPNQGSADPSTSETPHDKPEKYVTIPLSSMLKTLESRGIDMSRIVIVPDMTQQKSQETSDWKLPYETLAPDATSVMSFQQAIFETFQNALFGRGEKCKRKCAKSHEKAIIEIMEGYSKEKSLSFYIPTELVLANISNADKKHLCKKCILSRSKTPSTKPYHDKEVYDTVPKVCLRNGKNISNSEDTKVWEVRIMLLVECLCQKFNANNPLFLVLSNSLDLLTPYKIRTSKDPMDKVKARMASTVANRTRFLGSLEGVPGMARLQSDAVLEACLATLDSEVEEQSEESEGEDKQEKPKEESSHLNGPNLDASNEQDENEMPKHNEESSTATQDKSSTTNTVSSCLPDVGECFRHGSRYATFLKELAEKDKYGATEQEKSEQDSELTELKNEMPEPSLQKVDARKTRFNFKTIIKNPDGSESVNPLGSFVLPEGVEFCTGQESESVPSPSQAQADINALISKRIAELEKMKKSGNVVNEKALDMKGFVQKPTIKELKKSIKKLETEVDQLIEEQKKSRSEKMPMKPVEPVKPSEPSGPVEPVEKKKWVVPKRKRPDAPYKPNRTSKPARKNKTEVKEQPEVTASEQPDTPEKPVEKKKWIVPKRKRPDAPYKPNRTPKSAHKKKTKAKKGPEVTDPNQPDAPEVAEPAPRPSEPLQAAPDAPADAPKVSEPLEAAPGPSEPQQPAPDTPEPPTPEEDSKAVQLARALEELRLVKLENRTLKAQIQKYEGMEIKMKKVTEEKRELKESHALELREIKKEHSELVRFQQDTIDDLRKKISDQSKPAGKKVQVLGATENWKSKWPEQENKRRESGALKKRNEEQSLEIKELKSSREKDAQKIRELEMKIARLTEHTPEELETQKQLVEVGRDNDAKLQKIGKLAQEMERLLGVTGGKSGISTDR